MPVRRSLLAVLLAALRAACGGEGGIDRSHYQPVFDATMRAVAAGDLQALDPLLSEEGRRRLQATLADFQHRLQDPEQGARILQLVAERRGRVDPAELETARHGTLADVWAFLLRASPREPVPARQTPRPLPDGGGVVVEYEDPDGTLRTVTLRARDGVWAVDDLQL